MTEYSFNGNLRELISKDFEVTCFKSKFNNKSFIDSKNIYQSLISEDQKRILIINYVKGGLYVPTFSNLIIYEEKNKKQIGTGRILNIIIKTIDEITKEELEHNGFSNKEDLIHSLKNKGNDLKNNNEVALDDLLSIYEIHYTTLKKD